jgi:hypothetical protein
VRFGIIWAENLAFLTKILHRNRMFARRTGPRNCDDRGLGSRKDIVEEWCTSLSRISNPLTGRDSRAWESRKLVLVENDYASRCVSSTWDARSHSRICSMLYDVKKQPERGCCRMPRWCKTRRGWHVKMMSRVAISSEFAVRIFTRHAGFFWEYIAWVNICPVVGRLNYSSRPRHRSWTLNDNLKFSFSRKDLTRTP